MLLREQFRVGRIEFQQLLDIFQLCLRAFDVFVDTFQCLDSLVVSPPISTVMPLILLAIQSHPLIKIYRSHSDPLTYDICIRHSLVR